MNVRTLSVLALGAALASAASAQATYFKRSLPDFDQRRSALSGGGNMFCVPTTYVDLFKFMAWNGLPDMDSAYGNGYSDISAFIAKMGSNMGTTAADGTSGNGAYNAATAWLSSHDNWFISLNYRYGPNTYWGPGKMRNLVSTGAMVAICYGRYEKNAMNTWTRKGGHCVALSGYDWRFATKKLLVADPAKDDGNNMAQGAYTIDEKTTALTAFVNSDGNVRILPRYDLSYTGTDNNKLAAVDYMHGMMPLWNGYFKGVTNTAGGTTSYFTASFPFQLTDGVNAPVKELTAKIDGEVVDWSMDHGDMAVVALTKDGVIHNLDLVSKESTRLGAFPGAKKLLVAGANLDVFALVDSGRTDTLVKIDRKTGKQFSMTVPKGLTGLEADPSTRGLIGLLATDRTIIAVDEDLRTMTRRPAYLPDGEGEFFLAPMADGSVAIARSVGRTMVRVGADGSVRTLLLPAVQRIREIRAVGPNRYMIQDGERMIALDGEGRVVKSQFDDVRSTERVRFAQSWSAMKPQDIEGKGWENVLPLRGQP